MNRTSQLQQDQTRLVAEAAAILEPARRENRALTADERREWDRLYFVDRTLYRQDQTRVAADAAAILELARRENRALTADERRQWDVFFIDRIPYLRQDHKRLVEEATAIVELARKENRSLTAGESAKWQQLFADINQAHATLNAVEGQARIARSKSPDERRAAEEDARREYLDYLNHLLQQLL